MLRYHLDEKSLIGSSLAPCLIQSTQRGSEFSQPFTVSAFGKNGVALFNFALHEINPPSEIVDHRKLAALYRYQDHVS